jgi:LmbE family N-acetylglucosaminyl deacetylase
MMIQVQPLLREQTNLSDEGEALPGAAIRQEEAALLATIFERNGRVESVEAATPPGYVYVPEHPLSSLPLAVDGPIMQVAAHPGDGPDFFYATYLQMAANTRYDNAYHEILLTDGERGVDGWSPEHTRQVRMAEAYAGAEIVGSHLHFLGYPDGELASLTESQQRQLIARLAELIGTIQPALLVVHPPKHDHPDHAASFALTLAALELHARSGRGTPTLLVHDVEFGLQQTGLSIPYSSTIDDSCTRTYPLHVPGLLVDISATHQTAQRALHEHRTQMVDPIFGQPKVYADLIDTLARLRGLQLRSEGVNSRTRAQGFSHVVIPGVTSEQNVLPLRLPERSVFMMKQSSSPVLLDLPRFLPDVRQERFGR